MIAVQVKYIINKHRCRSHSYRSEGKETSAPLPSTATGSAKIDAIQKAVQRQSRKKPADDASYITLFPFRELVGLVLK